MISHVAIITQFKNLFATERERERERENEREREDNCIPGGGRRPCLLEGESGRRRLQGADAPAPPP